MQCISSLLRTTRFGRPTYLQNSLFLTFLYHSIQNFMPHLSVKLSHLKSIHRLRYELCNTVVCASEPLLFRAKLSYYTLRQFALTKACLHFSANVSYRFMLQFCTDSRAQLQLYCTLLLTTTSLIMPYFLS